jgi:hypothetical protein
MCGPGLRVASRTACYVGIGVAVLLALRCLAPAWRPDGASVVGSSSSSNGNGDFESLAVVYIVMGAYARSEAVMRALASLRGPGQWAGRAFVITDAEAAGFPASFELVRVAPASSVNDIKALKGQILDLLPASVGTVLYLDCDIFLDAPLADFLAAATLAKLAPAWAGAFADAGNHLTGLCAGCDTWHTGVLLVARSAQAAACLHAWAQRVATVPGTTDQEAFDWLVGNSQTCRSVRQLPKGDLLFLKDYLRLAVAPWRHYTFIHVTAMASLGKDTASWSTWLYRAVVRHRVPLSL